MLHTVNKSPTSSNCLESCLRYAAEGSAILLIEDGVYACLSGSTATATVSDVMKNFEWYALEADLSARGISDRVIDGVKMIGYEEFVELAASHDKVQSWF